jgi:phosphonate C-P lyase system protein PhnH
MRAKRDFDMVMGAQTIFRLLLGSLSNPGRPANTARCLPQFARSERWFALAVTLLDDEVGFYWNGEGEIADEICFLTGSSATSIERADFVFLPEPASPDEILESVKPGTHTDPHDSAMIIVEAGGPPEINASLSGPGVPPGGRNASFSNAERAWIEARERRAHEYPCGVELVFLRDGGEFLSVTRKVAVQWLM